MRKLTFGTNVSLDGYIAAAGDDIGWSVPSDELFQWWSDRVRAIVLALYGRRLWETMSSHWPTADRRQTGAARVRPPLAGRAQGGVLLDDQLGRLERPPRHGEAVITQLKAEDGGPMDIGGATCPSRL